jgi:hypothetical protein
MDQRAAKAGSLLHPARQLPHMGVLEAFKPYRGHQLAGGFHIRGGVLAIPLFMQGGYFQGQENVLQNRAPGHQCRILKCHADVADWTAYRLTADAYPARAGAEKAGNHP